MLCTFVAYFHSHHTCISLRHTHSFYYRITLVKSNQAVMFSLTLRCQTTALSALRPGWRRPLRLRLREKLFHNFLFEHTYDLVTGLRARVTHARVLRTSGNIKGILDSTFWIYTSPVLHKFLTCSKVSFCCLISLFTACSSSKCNDDLLSLNWVFY